MIKRLESKDSNFWSFVLASIFGILLIGSAVLLHKLGIDFRHGVGSFEFIVISLAVFRLTRLLVYDSIAIFIRDPFYDITKKWNEKEKLFEVTKTVPSKGLRRKLAELFECPWCIGTWVALFTLFLFYIHPIGWWFILGVAIAGLATFIQILINLIGWHAEGSKLSVVERHELKGISA